jgi:DMSO/TMAO reductase YedYZ heme-binding membrane subunit
VGQGRHRKRHVPGPVTAVNRVLSVKPKRKVSWLALRAWPAVPALFLIWPAYHGRIMSYADSVLGFDAVLSLVACLAVTPVITVAKMPVAKLRWWYGNWVFFLGAAGLAVHLAYPPGSMAARAAGNSVEWTGTLIIVLLLPMAATSSAAAQKLLGPEWKRWQRGLVWLVWAAIGLHLYLMHSWLPLGAYGGATLPAVLVRRPYVRRGIKAWRAGGYSTGGWWAVLAVLVVLAIAGFGVLAAEEVRAVARSAGL